MVETPRGDDGSVDMTGRYVGEADALGNYEGKGRLRYADGEVYEGEFKANLYHGKGKLEYANGDVYEGDFVSAKQSGKGTYRWSVKGPSAGAVYTGSWKAGERHGIGKFEFAPVYAVGETNGEVYEGDFEMGQLTGRGIYRYPNGDMFEGEVLNGVRQGPGYYLWSSGRLDLTAFQASKYAGNGVRWSAERDCAWRLVDGIETEAISLEQAEEERLVHEQLLADIVEAREKARAEAEEAAAAAAAAAAAGGGKKDDKKGKKK